ncbi:MAG TPA: MnhB domain-containing protein [Synergistales bacterium]|nr:MnhB domain-containing protein [Synergistales bacterium]HRV71070.1 MnhB domain-containing protein [Thermovirgaceae bacterium]
MNTRPFLFRLAAMVLCVSLGLLLYQGIAAIDQPAHVTGAAEHYLANTPEETGARNVVAAILFDYRAFDTLGESTVIFTAVCGISMLFSRRKFHRSSRGLSFIARRGIGLIVPFILMYASAIVLAGHLSPGGGFQGGTIFATVTVLLCVVYGSSFESVHFPPWKKDLMESAGALLFSGVGILGLISGAGFLSNLSAGFPPGQSGSIFSAGAIPVLNVAVALKVGAGLSTIFYSIIKLLEEGGEHPGRGH